VPELATRTVLLLHHTDCGAMAAMRHHDHLVSRMQQLLSEWGVTTWALQVRA
jgi:carbonic anhydrase